MTPPTITKDTAMSLGLVFAVCGALLLGASRVSDLTHSVDLLRVQFSVYADKTNAIEADYVRRETWAAWHRELAAANPDMKVPTTTP